MFLELRIWEFPNPKSWNSQRTSLEFGFPVGLSCVWISLLLWNQLPKFAEQKGAPGIRIPDTPPPHYGLGNNQFSPSGERLLADGRDRGCEQEMVWGKWAGVAAWGGGCLQEGWKGGGGWDGMGQAVMGSGRVRGTLHPKHVAGRTANKGFHGGEAGKQVMEILREEQLLSLITVITGV